VSIAVAAPPAAPFEPSWPTPPAPATAIEFPLLARPLDVLLLLMVRIEVASPAAPATPP
jgi:hypothetical protein